jgi:cob(I)alamin adenosyltransferase
MAKIYTKTGDSGDTGLIGGSRVPKNHVRVEAYGTLDEANALLGLILSRFTYFTHYDELRQIQHMLFEIGATLADTRARVTRPPLQDDVYHIEKLIDELSVHLPPLTQFILPGGTELASYLHLLRTIIRRAERRIITVQQHQFVPPETVRYVNRLSDYFFTLARAINHEHGVADQIWRQHPQAPTP